MAAAGFSNCHMQPSPCEFSVLGIHAFPAVQRLVSEMFTNDLPRLQVGGNLRPVIMISAARLVGSYNDLIRDFGTDHEVVKLIMEAARRAKVDDEHVKDKGGPRHHVVLKDWSRRVTEQFKEDNDQVSPDNPKVNEELLRKLIHKVDKLEASVAGHDERNRHYESALDEIKMQKEELASMKITMTRKEQHVKRLESV